MKTRRSSRSQKSSRSKRASQHSKRYSRQLSQQQSRRSSRYIRSLQSKYPTLEDVLTYFFNAGAHEIRKKEPSYIAPTAAEFLQEVKGVLRSTKSKTLQGGYRNRMEEFCTKLVGATVGTFDTPCNRFLSYFAIVVWASFFYTLAVSYFQMPESMLMSALANPVYAFLDILQGRVGSGSRPFQEMKDHIRRYVESMLPNISPMVGSGLQQVILMIINSQVYAHLVEKELACLFLALGEPSCARRCGI